MPGGLFESVGQLNEQRLAPGTAEKFEAHRNAAGGGGGRRREACRHGDGREADDRGQDAVAVDLGLPDRHDQSFLMGIYEGVEPIVDNDAGDELPELAATGQAAPVFGLVDGHGCGLPEVGVDAGMILAAGDEVCQGFDR